MRKCLLSALAILLMVSTNAQWLPQNPGFTRDTVSFYEISVPEKNTAWAVCYDFRTGLLGSRRTLSFTRTVDGGATWVPGKMGTDLTLRFSNISAIDGQEAWVAMHKVGPVPGNYNIGAGGSFERGGGIFHTTDGGTNWEHTAAGELFDNNSVPRFVHFKDKNHGIAVGDPNGGNWEIYLTNNKGKKWKRVPHQNIPAPLVNEMGWISGHAVVGNTVWFGTDSGRIYKSTDFGKSWTVHIVDPIPGTYVHEVAFLDDGLTGIAHLRGRSRTFVFSTTDGGLTWTNYFQPPNWKNSRVTAVPGTNAFISTSVHNLLIFAGSAISYDAGQTWTELDATAQKAACRFYDANTGYAGGYHASGHLTLGAGGIFKSQIVFQTSTSTEKQKMAAKIGSIDGLKAATETGVKVYPTPANDVINVVLQEELANGKSVISIVGMDGKVMQTTTSAKAKLVQLDVSKLPAGTYMLRIVNHKQTINKLFTITR